MTKTELKQIDDLTLHLKELVGKFDEFLEAYDRDMRGDTNAANGGARGIVNEIREMKKTLADYPSLTFLLAKKPFQTVGTMMIVFTILETLWTIGMFRLFAAMAGIELPTL